MLIELPAGVATPPMKEKRTGSDHHRLAERRLTGHGVDGGEQRQRHVIQMAAAGTSDMTVEIVEHPTMNASTTRRLSLPDRQQRHREAAGQPCSPPPPRCRT